MAGASCPHCHSPSDPFGDHFVCCHLNNLTSRHTALQDAILRVLEAGRVPCLREQSVSPEGHHRPADILLLHWAQGRDAALDLTITHPMQASEHPLTLNKVSAHLRRAEEGKVRKNERPCALAGWLCLPFGVHCWGGLGPSARACLQQIVKRVCNALEGWARIRRTQEIHQNLTFALMREVGRQLELAHRVQEGGDQPPPY